MGRSCSMRRIIIVVAMMLLGSSSCGSPTEDTHNRSEGARAHGSTQAYELLSQFSWKRGARFPKVEIRRDPATGQRGLFVKASGKFRSWKMCLQHWVGEMRMALICECCIAEVIEVGEPIIIIPGSLALRSSEVPCK